MQTLADTMANQFTGKVTRFQVMAILQAARARALGLDQKEAKSWGLNRALFYAAAKSAWRRAKAEGSKRPVIDEYVSSKEHHDPVYVLGGEKAFRIRKIQTGLRFKFGDRVQEPEDFDKQVKSRFVNWRSAWLEANRIVKQHPRHDLDIQSRFFNYVYKPNRDRLAKYWSSPGSLPRRKGA